MNLYAILKPDGGLAHLDGKPWHFETRPQAREAAATLTAGCSVVTKGSRRYLRALGQPEGKRPRAGREAPTTSRKKGHTNNPNGRPRKLQEPARIALRCEAQELSDWKASADAHSDTLTDWCRKTLNQAATSSATPAPLVPQPVDTQSRKDTQK